MKKLLFLVAMILTGASYVHADEGMWLPSEILKKIKDIQSQGFKLSAEDIYSVNKSSLKDAVVRFGGGCTGELISPRFRSNPVAQFGRTRLFERRFLGNVQSRRIAESGLVCFFPGIHDRCNRSSIEGLQDQDERRKEKRTHRQELQED